MTATYASLMSGIYEAIMNVKKHQLNLPQVPAPISVGSFVVFVDGSYTASIEAGSYELKKTFAGLSQDVYQVVAVNVPVPTYISQGDSLAHMNSCIVKNKKGDIVFCSKINLHNIREIGMHNPPFTLK